MTDVPLPLQVTPGLLPEGLAPALRARLQALLADVPVVHPPDPVPERGDDGPRCVCCHRGGRLGGHHAPDGVVQWVHRSCHRALHRRGRQRVPGAARARLLERRRAG